MADIVTIDRTNPNGAQVLQACALLRAGMAKLYEIDGMRAQAIGVGDAGATMAAQFGVTGGSAQGLSDRIAMLLAFHGTEFGQAGFEYTAKLRDLIDATFPA